MKKPLIVSALFSLFRRRLLHQTSITGIPGFLSHLKSLHTIILIPLTFFIANKTIAQTTDDYRTRNDGNWNGTATWQRYDGSSWVNITSGPDNTDKAITIRNGHTVIVTANVSADQVTVDAGGEIIVNASRTLTIANGSGTDLTMNGSLTNNGTITLTGALSNAGSFTNNGTMTNSNPFTNSGTLINSGTFTTSNPVTTSGTFTNNGILTTGNTFTNSGTFTNGGTITIGNTLTNNGTFLSSGSITNNATFANNSTGTISGTLTNTSNVNGSGALSFTAGSEYIHARNGGTIPTAIWDAYSTCTVTGIQGSSLNGLGQSFGNFTWNCTNQSADISLNANLTTVAGKFTVSSTKNKNLYLTNSNDLTMNIGGDLDITGGELIFVKNNNTDIALTIAGNLNISGGNLMFSEGNSSIATITASNVNMSSGDVILMTGNSATGILNTNAFNLSGGNFVFSSGNNATVTINVNGAYTQSSGSIDFSTSTQTGIMTMNVAGNFTQTAGSFDFASGNANTARTPALNLSGDFTQTGSAEMVTSTGDADITNGTIMFNKNGTQLFSIVTQSNLRYINFIVGTSSSLELNSNVTLYSISTNTWAGNFTINSGGTLNTKTYQILSSSGAAAGSNNDFILNTGATIMTANVNGLQSGTSGTISTAIANRTYSSGANYVYNGSSPQNSGTFTTSPTATQVNNLTVNNTGGGNGLTLEQPFKIAGTCYFTAGRITSSSFNLLIFNDNAIASGANNNVINPSYANGPVRKIGNDAFTFPVGKSNVGYMACGISAPGSMTDAFTAEYKRNSATALGSCTAPGLYRVSACEYWQLDRTTGSSSVNVTLSWSGLSPCNAAAYVNDLATLVVAHFNGTSWNTYGNNGGVTGNGAAGTVTWNNVSSFSPFTLGSTSPVANPLRVKFSEVKAYRVNDNNKIEWKNLTEENIDRYEVERSGNGTVFNQLLSVSPKSNNGLEESYSVSDQNTPGVTNFYRIKAIEVDGTFLYSAIVKVVSSTDDKSNASVYPNPVSGDQFTLQLSNYQRGNYNLRLISSTGQQVMNKSIQHAGGSVSLSINKPASINSGIYILQLTGENIAATMKVVIK